MAGQAGADGVTPAIVLAANEAATNAILHGEAGAVIDVGFEPGDGAVAVTVAERGGGLRHGLGLALISALADELEMNERAGGGTEVRMRFATQPRQGGPGG